MQAAGLILVTLIIFVAVFALIAAIAAIMRNAQTAIGRKIDGFEVMFLRRTRLLSFGANGLYQSYGLSPSERLICDRYIRYALLANLLFVAVASLSFAAIIGF